MKKNHKLYPDYVLFNNDKRSVAYTPNDYRIRVMIWMDLAPRSYQIFTDSCPGCSSCLAWGWARRPSAPRGWSRWRPHRRKSSPPGSDHRTRPQPAKKQNGVRFFISCFYSGQPTLFFPKTLRYNLKKINCGRNKCIWPKYFVWAEIRPSWQWSNFCPCVCNEHSAKKVNVVQ